MTLLNPAALWGLAGMLLLLLLSLWRLRPIRRVEPTIRLWERIPDRRPPVRAVQRPRWNLLLLLQMLVLAALVLAWARPATVSEGPAPRDIALVFDTSASMIPRMDGAKERARELLGMLSPQDRVTVIAEHGDTLETVHAVPCESDVRDAVRFADQDLVYVFTDEPIEGFRTVGTGVTSNTGIVDARIEGDSIFVRIAHVGPPVTKKVEGRDIEIDERGVTLTFPGRDTVRMEADGFTLDDVVVASPLSPVEVVLHGDPGPRFRKALGAMGNVHLSARGPVHLYFREVPEVLEGFAIVIQPPGDSFVPRSIATEDHEITRSVVPEEIVVFSATEVRWEGEVVVSADGKPVVVVGENQIVVGLEWRADGWPVYPSFPIFWTNVISYARRLQSDGFPRACEGEGPNLLSERETRAPGLERRPIERPPDPPRIPVERPLDVVLLGAGLLLLLASWGLARE